MGKVITFTCFMICMCFVPEAVADENVQNLYQLHQGDTVTVSVWREDTLRTQAIVLPDGSITLPLIGRVEIAGLTTFEAEQRITERLKEYLPDPIVSIVVSGIDGNRAFVMGKVLHPGPVVINGPITVLQAISIVGGFEKFADQSNIKVIRANADGQEILPVKYSDIISGKNMSTNIKLQAGDTIVVP